MMQRLPAGARTGAGRKSLAEKQITPRMVRIAAILRGYCRAEGISINELARRSEGAAGAGWNLNRAKDIASLRVSNPQATTLEALADTLGTTVDELVNPRRQLPAWAEREWRELAGRHLPFDAQKMSPSRDGDPPPAD